MTGVDLGQAPSGLTTRLWSDADVYFEITDDDTMSAGDLLSPQRMGQIEDLVAKKWRAHLPDMPDNELRMRAREAGLYATVGSWMGERGSEALDELLVSPYKDRFVVVDGGPFRGRDGYDMHEWASANASQLQSEARWCAGRAASGGLGAAFAGATPRRLQPQERQLA